MYSEICVIWKLQIVIPSKMCDDLIPYPMKDYPVLLHKATELRTDPLGLYQIREHFISSKVRAIIGQTNAEAYLDIEHIVWHPSDRCQQVVDK